MAILQVDVKPEILVQAREAMGLSRKDAAKELHMTEITLQYLEAGVGDVSLPRLKAMAKIYDRPLISFFGSDSGQQTDTLPDFRQLPSNRRRAWSPELHREYRRVAGQREIVLDLVASAELEPIPQIELRLDVEDDPEHAGLRVEDWLIGGLRESGTPSSLKEWSAAVEAKGILVTQVSGVNVSEMRGFSIGLHPLPVIALNGADSMSARLFSLIHELIHVLQHASALCDLRGLGRADRERAKKNEWFCNAVAAAVLMPRASLLQHESVVRSSRQTQWQFKALQALAAKYGVSAEAMLLRLISLERAAPDSYGVLKSFFDRLSSGKTGGFLPYYPGKIRNLGSRYISTVLGAYEQGKITDSTLTRYLDIKLKYLPKLIETFSPNP